MRVGETNAGQNIGVGCQWLGAWFGSPSPGWALKESKPRISKCGCCTPNVSDSKHDLMPSLAKAKCDWSLTAHMSQTRSQLPNEEDFCHRIAVVLDVCSEFTDGTPPGIPPTAMDSEIDRVTYQGASHNPTPTLHGDAVTADEILDLISSVDPAYRIEGKTGFIGFMSTDGGLQDAVTHPVQKLRMAASWKPASPSDSSPARSLHLHQTVSKEGDFVFLHC
jgi:hypothetical protein